MENTIAPERRGRINMGPTPTTNVVEGPLGESTINELTKIVRDL